MDAKSHTQKPDKKSIAVLPFQNRSANEENAEFFSEGVHDELLTNLSKIEAFETFAKIRQINPSSIYGLGPTCGVYIATGEMDKCYPWIFKAMQVDPNDYELPAWIVRGYIDFGDLHSAHRWLNWIERTYDRGPMALSSIAMIDVYEGNLDIAAERARNALEGKMPNRWGADAIMVRILLMHAVVRHESASALKVVRQAHPELFESSPRIDGANITQAIDSAHLLQMENQTDDAKKLLNAAIATFDVPYVMSGPYYKQELSVKAQALALLDEKQAAITELRQQVDKGWRLFWRWHTELNPNFRPLSNFYGLIWLSNLEACKPWKRLEKSHRHQGMMNANFF